ncbi:5-formyltetrahydrofolate cyclo-ligase [Paenibacillus sp. FSL R5-0810]|uniref:5-formyltetrahydrofolate cyclo-ligase n=1 Tax=Paenibacillus sp. FSL R5-0810 TaxID=2921659 RepID=UPI0030F6C59A
MSKFDEEKISGSMKQQLREQMTRLRSELSQEERSERSRQACGHASELMKQHSFKSMMIYVPFRSELDTRPLVEWAWQEGIRVIVPRSIPKDRSMELYEIRSWDELAPGAYGIMEPDPKRVSKYSAIPPDVIWVPGLAFDPEGGRLGYGGGYYDRLSGALEPDSRTEEAEERGKSWWIGLGYEIQLVNQVPMDEHDLRLDGVITDKGYYRAGIRSQRRDIGWN